MRYATAGEAGIATLRHDGDFMRCTGADDRSDFYRINGFDHQRGCALVTPAPVDDIWGNVAAFVIMPAVRLRSGQLLKKRQEARIFFSIAVVDC